MPNHWDRLAACKGMDTEIWFGEDTVYVTKAKEVCAACPVKDLCREEAIRLHLKGVWGETTDPERETIRRKRRTPDPSKRKPVCQKGHEFTPENTYQRPNGDRQCRVCQRSRKRARTAAKPPKPRPTHCSRGHEWKPETTYVDPRGINVCRTCRQLTAQVRREARRGTDRAAVA